MAKYDILRSEKDMAGKIQIWVDTGDGVEIFRSPDLPSSKEIQEIVDKHLAAKAIIIEEEVKRVDEEIARLTAKKQELEKAIPGTKEKE